MISLAVLIIVLGFLAAQYRYEKFVERKQKQTDIQELAKLFEEKFQKIDDLEKKVNSLAVRAGFKQ